MKKITFLVLGLFISLLSYGQTQIWQEDFETDGDGTRYTATGVFNDGNNDHFGRTDGSDISVIGGAYASPTGSFYWAAEDVDDNGGDGNDYKAIVFNQVNTSGFSNLSFTGAFASNEAAADYDLADGAVVSYSTDGGTTWIQALKFRYDNANDDDFNESLGVITSIDTSCLIGNPNGGFSGCDATETPVAGANITQLLTRTFTDFSFTIPGTPGTIDLRIELSFDSGDEEFAFDNFRLEGMVASNDCAITCPANISVPAAMGANTATVTYDDPTLSGDCTAAGFTQTAGLASGSDFPVGTTTNTFEAEDLNTGAIVSCSFTVTVTDDQAPELECQDLTIQLDDMGMASVSLADLITNAVDFPDPSYLGTGNAQPIPATGTGGFPCVGGPTESPATVDLTGTIGTDYNIASVEIDLTHTFDADLEMSLVAPSGTSLDLSSDNGGAGDNFTNTVFEDGAPSITTGSAPFTGTFQPEGGTFAAAFDGENVNGDWILSICDDAGGDSGTLLSYEITFSPVTPIIAVPDNSGPTSNITIDVDSFDCSNIGPNTVTITATDMDGNSTVCTPTVTILVDDITTFDSCPVDIFTGTGAGDTSCSTPVNYTAPTVASNVCGDEGVTLTAGLPSGSVFPVGETMVEYTSDNGVVCSFMVTVSDTTAPVIDCPDNLIVGADDAGNYVIEDYTTGIVDNCTSSSAIVISQEPAAGTVVTEGSTTTVTVVATDEAGNENVCTFDILVDSTLSISDASFENALTVFPNPTNGIVTISNGNLNTIDTITIIDMNGRVIAQQLNVDLTETKINMSNVASGVYFMQITSGDRKAVKRIVKQ